MRIIPKNERGGAMIFELLLVVVIVAIIGLAVYQSNRNAATPTTASGFAGAAVDQVTQDAADEAAASQQSEAAADELSAADSDISNLGGDIDESNF